MRPKDILEQYDLVFNYVLAAVICRICGEAHHPFHSTFRYHMLTRHCVTVSELDEIRKAARSLHSTMTAMHKDHDSYWRPNGRVLAPIQHLPILSAQKCTECCAISASSRSLQKHLSSMHRVVLPIRKVRKMPRLQAQRLNSRRSAWNIYEIWTAKPRECSGMHRRSAAEPGELIPAETTRGISVSRLFGSDKEADGCQTYCPNGITSVFAEQARLSERLQFLQTSLVDCAALRVGMRVAGDLFPEDAWKKLRDVCRKYAMDVIAIANGGHLFPGEMKRLTSPGASKTNRAINFNLQDSTILNYAKHTVAMCLAAFRIFLNNDHYKHFPLSANCRQSCAALLGSLSSATGGNVRQDFHRFLCTLLLETAHGGRRPRDFFIYGYIMCLCTQNTSDSDPTEKARIRRGVEVSPALAGLLYFASAEAVTEMSGYADEDRKECLQRISQTFLPGASSAVGLLSKLRSTCASLRYQERSVVAVNKCKMPGHENCIVIDGHHLTAKDVGDVIRSLHRQLHKLERLLLFSEDVPDRLNSGMDHVYDNPSCRTPGYSFEKDTTNKEFVEECSDFMHTLLLRHVGSKERKADRWKQNALLFTKQMLGLIHICSGSPGRCTELSALLLHNTLQSGRNVYINGREVIISPSKMKQDCIAGGVQTKLFRFLDGESSRLFKRYVLFYRKYLAKLLDDDADTSLLFLKTSWLTFPHQIVTESLRLHKFRLNTRQYRQWFGFYGKDRARQTENQTQITEERRKEGPTVLSAMNHGTLLQGGHSFSSAWNDYGVGEEDVGLSAGDAGQSYMIYRAASKRFHLDCGIAPSF